MKMNAITRYATTAAVVIGVTCAACGANAAAKKSPAETAIQAAAKQNRYTIVTFYKRNDAASTKMLAEARKLQIKHSNRANFVIADVDNIVHQSVIERYSVDRFYAPVTLVIAPNGAVTAGYPNEISTTDLSDSFVSVGMADVLKTLQDGKLAAVCLQNSKTKLGKESLAAAEGVKEQFRGAVEIVKIDPADTAEAKFVEICKVDANTDSAQLVIIVPPGRIIGTFDGAATTDSIAAALTKALSGSTCGSGGCGSGGCGK